MSRAKKWRGATSHAAEVATSLRPVNQLNAACPRRNTGLATNSIRYWSAQVRKESALPIQDTSSAKKFSELSVEFPDRIVRGCALKPLKHSVGFPNSHISRTPLKSSPGRRGETRVSRSIFQMEDDLLTLSGLLLDRLWQSSTRVVILGGNPLHISRKMDPIPSLQGDSMIKLVDSQ